ncbi:predicted protein [Postia placenta Mad-698-R]|uniref:Uncharacterized protein n=1 Tax=Postia placenta MAD-698-R-SB12 TaxID=670580 RepID=A0A1X6NEK5_9APHY|nr:hypothetical protein POSPLADRAFT_1042236 [Postia placenta MAD-698-R-SB12]EED80212.1 predicted protein [Postia placenta Mad-698-R]OSX66942.1 hypothetical protein POSPLADRAFT_1042236 [Postia placenta MAD-698-R-SB12]
MPQMGGRAPDTAVGRREGQAWACQAAHPPAKKHALCDRTPPRWALAAALGAMPISCAAVRPAHSRRCPSPSERTASVWRLRVAAGPAIGDMGSHPARTPDIAGKIVRRAHQYLGALWDLVPDALVAAANRRRA